MTGRKLFLGIDGGQSSTVALIGDETGQVIGQGRGGPCNHAGLEEGRARFIAAVRQCLDQVCAEAGIDPGTAHFEAVCGGFSGGPEAKQAILREIIRTDRLLVTSDAQVALSGALAGQPGIVVIGGTGSIAMGRNSEGTTAQAGGWGYAFGDEGSAFDIVRQALRAALRFEEGWGPSTIVREMLLAESGARNANELLHRFYTNSYPRVRVAAYAPVVDRAAERGDREAREILRQAAAALAQIAEAVRSQLFAPKDPVRVAFVGGVFRSRHLREDFCELLNADDRTSVSPGIYSPATGALIEAYRLAEIHVSFQPEAGPVK